MCSFCDRPAKSWSKKIPNLQFCKQHLRKLIDNFIIGCVKCGAFTLVNKDDFILENADHLHDKPWLVKEIRSPKPKFLLDPECKVCKGERTGWILTKEDLICKKS